MFNWPWKPREESAGPMGAGPDSIALVAGLGNPGSQYLRTRHNLGFLALDHLAERHSLRISRNFRRSLVETWRSPWGTALLVQPQTFMNLSGESVAAIASFYHLTPAQALVVCDDVALPFGQLRIRRSGSEGGHNGLKSLTHSLGSRDYARMRIGVGGVPPRWNIVDYVLGEFPPDEWKQMSEILDRAADAIECVLSHGVQTAMSQFNGAS